MKISILDDDHDTLRTLDCFANPSGHDVEVSVYPHGDVDACTELGVVVSLSMHRGTFARQADPKTSVWGRNGRDRRISSGIGSGLSA